MTARSRLLLAVPLLGLIELGGALFDRTRAPAFEDWTSVRQPAAALRKDGDLVVVAPRWAEPAARWALGDEFFALRDVARADVTRYRGAIEISIGGERAPELLGFREVDRTTSGAFTLRRLENLDAATVTYDFTDHVRPQFAEVLGTEPAAPCRWNDRAPVLSGGLRGHPTFPAARFECPRGPPFDVGVTVIADQDFLPRRCVWAHPPARGDLVLRFHGVALGRVIRGHAGISWFVERERKGAPVSLTARVDGDTVGTFVHADGDGWASFELPLGAHAGAPSAEVELVVHAGDPTDRDYCFEADTR